MCLIALVYLSGDILELIPDLIAFFFGHRTGLTPFDMKFLKPAECRDHIRFFHKLACLIDQKHLYIKILAEIVVTQIFIDFQLIIIALLCILERTLNISLCRWSHLSYAQEFLPQFLKALICTIHIICIGGKSENLVHDSLLRFQICSFNGFLLHKPSLFLCFNGCKHLAQFLLKFVFGSIGLSGVFFSSILTLLTQSRQLCILYVREIFS